MSLLEGGVNLFEFNLIQFLRIQFNTILNIDYYFFELFDNSKQTRKTFDTEPIVNQVGVNALTFIYCRPKVRFRDPVKLAPPLPHKEVTRGGEVRDGRTERPKTQKTKIMRPSSIVTEINMAF